MTRFNGQPLPENFAGTRALHYGDGVFRTLLVWDGAPVDFERHAAKLAQDAEALELECPPVEALRSEVQALCTDGARGVLKLILSRRDSGRGYAPNTRAADLLVQRRDLPQHDAACWTQGVNLGWSEMRLAIQPRLAGLKHLNRLEQVLASRGWAGAQHEALMCDHEGRVTCGTRSNLFFVIDGVLVTPDLSLAGVAGVMREKLIGLARAGLGSCEIGLIAPDEVRHASEAFLCNAVLGIWPVARIGSLELAAPGPCTAALIAALQHPWRGTRCGF